METNFKVSQILGFRDENFKAAVITMFSDIKESVLSYKHTRNLRREIKTTAKKEK